MERPWWASWLAGVIDGEGSIGFDYKGNRQNIYLRVSVGNTSLELLEAIHERTNAGRLNSANTKKNIERGYRPIFVWRASGQEAEDVLLVIHPFLIVKAAHSEVALRFRGIHQLKRFSRLDEEQIKIRRGLFDEMRVLNQRGSAAYSGPGPVIGKPKTLPRAPVEKWTATDTMSAVGRPAGSESEPFSGSQGT